MKLTKIKEFGTWTTEKCLSCNNTHEGFDFSEVSNGFKAYCEECGQLVSRWQASDEDLKC